MIRDTLLAALRGADDWVFERIGPIRILFVLSDGYGFSGQAEVIRHLLRFDSVVVAATTAQPRTVQGIGFADDEDEALFCAVYVAPRQASFRKWHIVVDTHRSAFYPKRRALRAFMHHGPGFGTLGSKASVAEDFDVFLGLSASQRDIFERLQPGLFDKSRAFFAVGFPKDDPIVNRRYSRQAVLSELGLADLPTILITSHWEEVGTLRTLREEPFRRLAEVGDWNIIQTGHPWLWEEGRKVDVASCATLVDRLRAVESRFLHARFLPMHRVEPLLAAADLLVSDHSSVITTYSLLDRPIVWFDNPDFEFAIEETKTIYRQATHSFSSMNDLVSTCRAALADPDSRAQGRCLMREAFHANPGTAGATAAEVLRAIGRCSRVGGREWERVMALSREPAQLPGSRRLNRCPTAS